MLEVKNLKKVYKTKDGSDVNALDGVSLSFPETGMVFLLGKSGSGKSTLLNICGGLDTPTEGEIIVKGRSSKDFSQSDFDSYRNTFIGFIFQEYNILNEFSVEDNIALALELQGKPKDKAAVAALLEEVDLAGFSKRKPNTLSGGQKQRIAIARALFKNPEIIMADEPTGALDSNTGKQVLDTLKKLSKNKLVIVVSHDREFAELYGDRIIELKDGKVLSDVSKTYTAAEKVSSNVSLVGDVVCIKKGAELSENDFASIKNFLKDAKNDIIIASNKKTVKNLKAAARITDADEMEVFKDTDPYKSVKKSYTKEDSRFIRSKLPFQHAFKIGVSGLKSKPIRLFFTVILCSIAFIFFSLLSTLNFYDSEATFKQTLRDSELAALQLTKEYSAEITWFTNGKEDYTFESIYPTSLSPSELESLSSQYNPNAFGAVYANKGFNLRQIKTEYWQNNISAFAVLPKDNSLREKINGAYPQNENEMVISTYFAEMLMACNVYDTKGTALSLSSAPEIIGKTIIVDGAEFKVTGILDTGAIPEKFDPLKEEVKDDDFALLSDLVNYLDGGLHQIVFVSEKRLEAVAGQNQYYKESKETYMRMTSAPQIGGKFDMPSHADTFYNSVSFLSADEKLYPVSKADRNLKDNEVILPSNKFASFVAQMYSKLYSNAAESENFALAEKYSALERAARDLEAGGVYEHDKNKDEHILKPFTDAEYQTRLEKLVENAKQNSLPLVVGLQLYDEQNQTNLGEVQKFNIVSVYNNSKGVYEFPCYLSNGATSALWDFQKVVIPSYPESKTNYVEDENSLYSAIYLPGSVEEGKIDIYWNLYSNEAFSENSSRITLTGGFVDTLKTVDYMVKDLSKIFLYIGLVLAVFAALLLSNFISVSISNKKREIGILRAVGARSVDVFKIFFSESFVIGAICVTLACASSIIICSILNKELAAELGASIFVFGFASFIVLVAIAFVTILVATFLPVYNAAKKKPVDSIRAI